MKIVKDFNERLGSLAINGLKNSVIYFSILYMYLTSITREAEQESLSNVSNPYLLLGPWVFSQM